MFKMNGKISNCEMCTNYVYDEDYDCYVCMINQARITAVRISGLTMNTELSVIRINTGRCAG